MNQSVPVVPALKNGVDQKVRAALGRATGSLSMGSLLLATTDWAIHLLVSPTKQVELGMLAVDQAKQLAHYAVQCVVAGSDMGARRCIESPAQDRRFGDEAWLRWPYNVIHQSFLLTERWWSEATRGVLGVEGHHEQLVSFATRQFIDVTSPGNLLWTNPVAMKRTVEQGGLNLARGAQQYLADVKRAAAGLPPPGAEKFVPGRNVAITPGKVVVRNRLIELIQYSPTTEKVSPEPILLVPAWIMKYYILDLSPENSLVKYLVDGGHTVFCVSWKNPTAADADLGMDDYLRLGFYAALDAIRQIVPERKAHALGYCLGGTLLAVAAAAMARDGDDRLASLTMLTAQTNFSEPGELGLFIDEAQVSLLEAQAAETGYLTSQQMAGAFQLLRSYDLIWSRLTNQYLFGEVDRMNDLMAWNADGTRLPARMHSEYLRAFYVRDDLAENRYRVDGRPISLADVKCPIFLVGTVTDHVAPWRSVYKLHYLTPAEITFVLTSGGHNAGIVNPPGLRGRHYQILKSAGGEPRLNPDHWLVAAPDNPDSWWPALQNWLREHSSAPVGPPRMGIDDKAPLEDAPGHYVLEK
ncbi:MAG: PHA/PHB synthase family protein [Burkholderiales bacterium]